MNRAEILALRTYRSIKEELASIKERDPAATSGLEVALLYSGFHAVLAYRVAHILHTHGHVLGARVISQGAKFLTGIEIHPGAKIGKGLFIDHGSGVVIGETAEIGDVGKRHPTLGNNVMIGAGAKVLGPFRVGDNSKIAANAVVLSEVPPDSTAVGIPAKVVKRNDRRVDLDQVHIPDPVSQELCRLTHKIELLEKRISELENGEK